MRVAGCEMRVAGCGLRDAGVRDGPAYAEASACARGYGGTSRRGREGSGDREFEDRGGMENRELVQLFPRVNFSREQNGDFGTTAEA